jgi:lysophospholipid acyltransferase (LPLAT)-like uncharacterized protein
MRRFKYLIIGLLGSLLIRLWGATWRLQVEIPHDAHRRSFLAGQRVVIAVWHENLLVSAWWLAPIHTHTLISKSSDGDVIASICRRMGGRIIRGSSSRGGTEALQEVIDAGSHEEPFVFGVTVDGPRGPRRVSKFGALVVARDLGIPILPLAVHASSAWRAKSWDRFLIPKPFARITVTTGKPILIPRDAQGETLADLRQQLDHALLEADESLRNRGSRADFSNRRAA